MNQVEIRRCLEVFKPEGRVIEIRVIDSVGNIFSGYYKDVKKLLNDIEQHDDKNIYFVLNDIKEDCYSRHNRERLIKTKDSSKDSDIEWREWILIDLDPKRVSKVSATEEEKKVSKDTANLVYLYLAKFGFSKPVVCDSGNGVHLLYRVQIENTDEFKTLIQRFLAVLSMKFTTDFVDVDTSVFNASRITKLYGTVARKGSSTETRPHRESKIVKVPPTININSIELLKRVVELEEPKPEKPTHRNNYNTPAFDLRDFIRKHNIQIDKELSTSHGTKFLLRECPFCGNKSPDSALFLSHDGASGFSCFHNSCQGKKWREFRMYYEPEAYDRAPIDPFRTSKPVRFEKKPEDNQENEKDGKVWEDFCDIVEQDRNLIVSIPSGFKKLDEKVYGFDKKNVIIWSGGNASAKSTILNQVALHAVHCGFKGGIWSGELHKGRLKKWLFQQAAGKQNVIQSQVNITDYFVSTQTKEKIGEWLKGKLFNYNNKYSSSLEVIIKEIRKLHEEVTLDFIILDNLMALNILSLEGDKNDKQTECIRLLHELAEELDIVIHIVMHPRKGDGFPRKEDIAGSMNLSNFADAIYIVHRMTDDFMKRAGEYWGQQKLNINVVNHGYTNIIECCKHREFGHFNDQIVGLYYEETSKRLLNDPYEHWEYGWNTFYYDPTPEPIDLLRDFSDRSFTNLTDNFLNSNQTDDICPF